MRLSSNNDFVIRLHHYGKSGVVAGTGGGDNFTVVVKRGVETSVVVVSHYSKIPNFTLLIRLSDDDNSPI